MLVPSYAGGNLANLIAELELRLTGQSPTAGLRSEMAGLIPDRRNYALVVFDGLGDLQLAPRQSTETPTARPLFQPGEATP